MKSTALSAALRIAATLRDLENSGRLYSVFWWTPGFVSEHHQSLGS